MFHYTSTQALVYVGIEIFFFRKFSPVKYGNRLPIHPPRFLCHGLITRNQCTCMRKAINQEYICWMATNRKRSSCNALLQVYMRCRFNQNNIHLCQTKPWQSKFCMKLLNPDVRKTYRTMQVAAMDKLLTLFQL